MRQRPDRVHAAPVRRQRVGRPSCSRQAARLGSGTRIRRVPDPLDARGTAGCAAAATLVSREHAAAPARPRLRPAAGWILAATTRSTSGRPGRASTGRGARQQATSTQAEAAARRSSGSPSERQPASRGRQRPAATTARRARRREPADHRVRHPDRGRWRHRAPSRAASRAAPRALWPASSASGRSSIRCASTPGHGLDVVGGHERPAPGGGVRLRRLGEREAPARADPEPQLGQRPGGRGDRDDVAEHRAGQVHLARDLDHLQHVRGVHDRLEGAGAVPARAVGEDLDLGVVVRVARRWSGT